MITKLLLTGLLLLAAPALEDCGGPPSSGGECAPFCPVEQQQQRQQTDDGCPPPVAWIKPGAGTVTDVMVCPVFGIEMRYILVDSGPRQVWLSDPGGSCRVGSDWGPVSC